MVTINPDTITFIPNGRIIFAKGGVDVYSISSNVSIALSTKQDANYYRLIFGNELAVELYSLLEIYNDVTPVSSYIEVDRLANNDIVSKAQSVFTTIQPLAQNNVSVTVNAPVTVDGPITVEPPVVTSEGYSYLSASDVLRSLGDGVDDSSTPVPIPADATGCSIDVRFTSNGAVLWIASSGSVPDAVAERGTAIYENNTRIFLGKTDQSDGPVSEMSDFRCIMNATKTAKLSINYYRVE